MMTSIWHWSSCLTNYSVWAPLAPPALVLCLWDPSPGWEWGEAMMSHTEGDNTWLPQPEPSLSMPLLITEHFAQWKVRWKQRVDDIRVCKVQKRVQELLYMAPPTESKVWVARKNQLLPHISPVPSSEDRPTGWLRLVGLRTPNPREWLLKLGGWTIPQ